MVLIEDKKVEFDKDIFKIFRKHNILEYKNLHDSLNERVIRKIAADREKANNLRDHYRVLIELLALKNPQIFEEIRRNDMDGGDVLMEIMKDRVDEKVNEKEQETTVNHLKNIMESLGLSLNKAMETLKIPQSQRSVYAGLIKK